MVTISARGCRPRDWSDLLVDRGNGHGLHLTLARALVATTTVARRLCWSIDYRHGKSILWAGGHRGPPTTAKKVIMQLSESAHVDTFCRDNLPPPEQWPELLLDFPDVQYPDRLNCAVELLDRGVEAGEGDRPCLLSPDGTAWTYADLLRTANQVAHVLVDEPRRRPRQPRAAACPEQPVAGRLLDGRAQGRRGRGHHDAAAAQPRACDGRRDRRGPARALRPPVPRGPRGGARAPTSSWSRWAATPPTTSPAVPPHDQASSTT